MSGTSLIKEQDIDLDSLAVAVQSLIDDGVIDVATVKKVQSGIVLSGTVATGYESINLSSTYTKTYYVDVPISAVSDISKCQISIKSFTSAGNQYGSIAKLLNASTLRIYFYATTPSHASTVSVDYAISWEVTEFA